jgi:hypothetical protein
MPHVACIAAIVASIGVIVVVAVVVAVAQAADEEAVVAEAVSVMTAVASGKVSASAASANVSASVSASAKMASPTEMSATHAAAKMAATSAAPRIGRADGGARHHQACDARESQCLKGPIHRFISIREWLLKAASRGRLSDAGVTFGVNPNARWATDKIRGGAKQNSQCDGLNLAPVQMS